MNLPNTLVPLQKPRACPRRDFLFPVSFLYTLSLYFSTHFSFLCILPSSALLSSLNLLNSFKFVLEKMGRFAYLVDSEEGLENFKAQYRIPPGVAIKYCKEGQWFEDRKEGEVVIPMIAFIEGGMRVLMGIVTRDYLRAHRLTPTQCAPNMFRILGSIDALNEKMGLGLTHHNVNWV